MREIVLDTETTGFDPETGDRIVEIGAVELFNHLPTGKVYHQYIKPERGMPTGAFEVHGLGDEFLRDKPVFSKVGQQFLDWNSRGCLHQSQVWRLPEIDFKRFLEQLFARSKSIVKT